MMGHQSLLLIFLIALLGLESRIWAADLVYIHSGKFFGQLVTSSTLRWNRGNGLESASLPKLGKSSGQTQNNVKTNHKDYSGFDEERVICRMIGGSRNVGIVQLNEVTGEKDICVAGDKVESSSKYQTISSGAGRLVWSQWKRPNPPPSGAIAIQLKPQKFLATNIVNNSQHSHTHKVGYLDPNSANLGSVYFPGEIYEGQECLVLTEIEPLRYELGELKLSRDKGFQETQVILDTGILKYDLGMSSEDFEISEEMRRRLEPQKVEMILSYESSLYDYWAQGHLMVKGLHTAINLPENESLNERLDSDLKSIYMTTEWGIPLIQTGRIETFDASEILEPGTAINLTLYGMKLNGGMSYEGTLKTIFKDTKFSLRPVDGYRKVEKVINLRLEKSKPYFIKNGSYVPDPTTPTTTSTTTTMSTTTSTTESPAAESSEKNTSEKGDTAALPREMQRDESQHLLNNCEILCSRFYLVMFMIIPLLMSH